MPRQYKLVRILNREGILEKPSDTKSDAEIRTEVWVEVS